METVATDLEAKLKIAQKLKAMSEQIASRSPGPGKWSAKEIIGHLIDSAANNHQRFVRMQMQKHLELEGYDGDEWVRLERYGERPWPDVVTLWESYNRHLAHVIRYVEAAALKHTWRSPEGQIVDLE